MIENISQNLLQSYQEDPDRVAVTLVHSNQPEQVLTFRKLLQKSVRFAQAMRSSSIRPGEVVIFVLHHGGDLVTGFLGAILCGAIPSIMPFLTEKLIPEQYRNSLSTLLKITRPAAVITYYEFADEVRNACSGTSVRNVFISNELPDESTQWNNNQNWTELAGFQNQPDEVVLLQHSSGTTGLQKGVALSHQAVFNQLRGYSKALHLTKSDVIVSWLPLYHDMGLIAGFIMPILCRVPLVLMSPFEWVRAPYRLLQNLSQYHGTLCWLPNFAYNFCAQKIRNRDIENIDLSSVRAIINCSEPIYWKSHAMFLERFQPYGFRPEALATSYAMAENVFAVSQGGIEAPITIDIIDQRSMLENQIAKSIEPENLKNRVNSQNLSIVKMVSAGKPIEGTSIRVLDNQQNDLPERQIGEIAIQSNSMLTEFYNRPDLTEKAFHKGWYLTGDLGYLADGELYVTGRKKDLIIVGGKNIYPQDLENLTSEVSGVHPGRVAAFGVFNEETGTEDVVIIAEVESDNKLSGVLPNNEPTGEGHNTKEIIAANIRQHVTRSSDVAVRTVCVVERNWLIKTSSGKVARQANKNKYLTELTKTVE